jgi:hypothetical protein
LTKMAPVAKTATVKKQPRKSSGVLNRCIGPRR